MLPWEQRDLGTQAALDADERRNPNALVSHLKASVSASENGNSDTARLARRPQGSSGRQTPNCPVSLPL